MDPRSRAGRGWVAYAAIVLTIAGIFGVIDGLMAVYKSSFFVGNAVFVFSDLRAWGWITFGLGVASLLSGLYVLSGSQAARWTGVTDRRLERLGATLVRPGVSAVVVDDHDARLPGHLRACGARQPRGSGGSVELERSRRRVAG